MDTAFFIVCKGFIEALDSKGILHELKKSYYVSLGMTLQLSLSIRDT